VEKARQHSAVAPEQRAFAWTFFAGHAMLLFGIIALVMGYDRGVTIGVVGLAASKIALAVWSFARPDIQPVQRSKLARVVVAIGWSVFAGLLVWTEVKK
jgi:hypothetical protein